MAFDKFKSPRIGSAPKQYEISFFNQLARALDNFFTTVDSTAGMNMSSTSTASLKTPFAALALNSGVKTNSDMKLPPNTFLRVEFAGAAGNFDFTGFVTGDATYNSAGVLTSAAADGQQLIILNTTGYNMSIYNEDTTCTAPARILTGSGTTINHSNGVVSFIYSAADARWAVISHQG